MRALSWDSFLGLRLRVRCGLAHNERLGICAGCVVALAVGRRRRVVCPFGAAQVPQRALCVPAPSAPRRSSPLLAADSPQPATHTAPPWTALSRCNSRTRCDQKRPAEALRCAPGPPMSHSGRAVPFGRQGSCADPPSTCASSALPQPLPAAIPDDGFASFEGAGGSAPLGNGMPAAPATPLDGKCSRAGNGSSSQPTSRAQASHSA